ncbi:hypothetical protein J2Z21_002148 [Streptomyces griseochromogenes]|uniref:GH18 domain-containing protein n=1 Tax=Streptomyces griseochromogenes TaxID=68214 RepID=A0ABS4LPN5_9ACTN|nr:hypothetical protein [Streptomyces griseochromogenes]MBP2049217.1 hypothetical protein [Streptomyces griseochromogenes]
MDENPKERQEQGRGQERPAPADAEQAAPTPPAPVGGEDAAQRPLVLDDESRTGGAGGNTKADGGAEAKRRRPRRRTLLTTAVLLLLLPFLSAETALRLNYTGTPKPGTHTRHKDALWLGHAWLDGRKTDADVKALAHRLKDTGIRDLYVHAGPLEHDGTLPKSAYPKARWLISALHGAAPRVRVQAWLGDRLASESPDGLHLERAATRTAIVASARQILATGFQGTHFDLEPLHSGDRDYLSLLDDLRTLTRAHHAALSVAAHQIDPLPAFHSFWGATTGHPKWWSQAYFGQVARRVDQIAVMSYDTMQPLQSLYGGYVAEQTSLALEVTPRTTDLLMGLPFYHDDTVGHWARAETVPAGVRGVRLGLSRTDADRARFGVALYVDFAATEADWRGYREDWVG